MWISWRQSASSITVNGVDTSFSEMMAMPTSQLDNIYWLPWYNNKNLDTQLRIANVSGATATVHVSIGGMEMTGSPFTIPAGASRRLSFPGIDKGPVKIESNVDIVAAERIIYKVNGVKPVSPRRWRCPTTSSIPPTGCPGTTAWTSIRQLRFANVSATQATVHVYIGETEMRGSPFLLAPGASRR